MNKHKLEAFLTDYKKLIEKHNLCFEAQLFYDNPYIEIIKIADLGCSIEEELKYLKKNNLELQLKK